MILGASRLLLALVLSTASSLAQDMPLMVVLGIGQDGGVPQLGSEDHPAWDDPDLRQAATSLALVDPKSGQRWLFEATPDIRQQMRLLHTIAPAERSPGIAGIFLTHAHMGHYTGLLFLGHESLGAQSVPVFTMRRMATFLASNGPWDQLVRYRNIQLRVMEAGTPIRLTETLTVTPFLVPHRPEYSEVVGYRIAGPRHSVLFIPDIDSWEQWDRQGHRLEDELAQVDRAWLDGTFYADGEIPGRDMSTFPHPRISETMNRLADLPRSERGKLHFIHLNHTNPALRLDSKEAQTILESGFGLARTGDRFGL